MDSGQWTVHLAVGAPVAGRGVVAVAQPPLPAHRLAVLVVGAGGVAGPLAPLPRHGRLHLPVTFSIPSSSEYLHFNKLLVYFKLNLKIFVPVIAVLDWRKMHKISS